MTLAAFGATLVALTCLLALGCATRVFRLRPDGATRLQRTALVAAFALLIVFAVIASVPSLHFSLVLVAPPESSASVAVAKLSKVPTAKPVIQTSVAPVRGTEVAVEPWRPTSEERGLAAGLVALCGTLIGFGFLAQGHRVLRRLHRQSVPVEDAALQAEAQQVMQAAGEHCPELRWHPDNAGPLVAGVRRPTLYLPAEMPEEAALRQMLFAHEIEHVRRNDVAYLLASRMLCALLWWHPLTYVLAREMERTAEEACDLSAVSGRGADAAPQYTRFLLNQARPAARTLAPLTIGMAAPRSQVGRRIAALLTGKGDVPASSRLRAGIVAGAAGIVVLAAIVQSSLSAPRALASAPASDYVPTSQEYESALITSRNVWGLATADIQVIEFSDFECPACRSANHLDGGMSRPWRKAWPNVWVQFRHLPLPMHNDAERAALAVEKLGQIGYFWDSYDDMFYGNDFQRQLSHIERAGLPIPRDAKDPHHLSAADKQEQARAEPQARARIERDKALAQRWNIDATPTYIVRDRRDNKIHRLVGYTALATYLDIVSKPLTPLAGAPNDLKTPRMTLALRDTNLPMAIQNLVNNDMGVNVVIDPNLDLSKVLVTMRVQEVRWPELLQWMQRASPKPFDIRVQDAKTVVLLPPKQ